MNTPVLRYAFSPTGHLTVLGLRSALLNWLYARTRNGRFVLRIDDLENRRAKAEFVDAIKDDLTWLGLDWDEEQRLSDRASERDKALERIRSKGRLYECFETDGELNWKRKAARQRHQPYVYDRKALELNEAGKQKFRDEGRSSYWRFKLADGVVKWDDLALGAVHLETRQVSDPIVIREDGTVHFLLSSAMSDLDLGVTHILRGEEHVSDTPAELQIHRLLGGKGERIRFGHLPALAGPEGAKLDRRLGAMTIRELRNDGFEKESLLGLLAHSGSGKRIDPRDLRDLLIAFDVKLHAQAKPAFDPAALAAVNEKAMRAMGFSRAQPKLAEHGMAEATEAFWNAVRTSIWRVEEARDWWEVVAGRIQSNSQDAAVTGAAMRLFPDAQPDAGTWRSWMAAVADETAQDEEQVQRVVYAALTGREPGPSMSALLPLIGREKSLARLHGERA